MSTKLPADLTLFSMWSAKLGLTPIVSSSVENILRDRGAFTLIPGQRSPHVSAKVAMQALEEFVERAGIAGFMHDQNALRKEEARRRRHIEGGIARDMEKLK